MQALELLSPAKNLQCGISAIDHGADAVYIGANKYGARQSACNSLEDIGRLCEYAHQFGAKVYVTVNTIIYDEELNDTIALCKDLKRIGTDAILFQDMGLLTELKRLVPELRVHASTQTDNRTVEKVKWLAAQGVSRVVLARELSIKEIEAIHTEVPEVELEVFVHGALCVSYSGQCYASHYCFGRSANRGGCAQFCRMAFTLSDATGKEIECSRHLLSLKDMSQYENIERLVEAGAVSFKIEGRLKDLDYVKNVTAAYSEKLNEICDRYPEKYCRASMGRCRYTFTPNLNKSFNRGFTTYFADGRQYGMISPDTPKAIGEYAGRVKEIRGNSFNVASTIPFSNGDGLCFFNQHRQLIGFRVNRSEGNRLFPQQMPQDLHPGVALYRNHDHAFQALLSHTSAERKIAAKMLLRIDDNLLTLTFTDERNVSKTTTEAYIWQKAEKPQEANIRKQLSKLGGTPFVCNDIQIECNGEVPFITSSLLAKMRRDVVMSGDCVIPKNVEVTEDFEEEVPTYPLSYLYNAANTKAVDFYKKHGVEAHAFETGRTERGLLMQCRFCLRYEMGYCARKAKKLPWKEPLKLTLDDGKSFILKFNCKECQMEVWA